jgi:quercetin dioxygenase-like cupin family protein
MRARESGSIKTNGQEPAMSEMRPNSTQQDCVKTGAVQITMHELEPKQGFQLPPCEHTVLVTDGLLYVVLEDDEVALIPGDEVVIGSGKLQFAWNPGSDMARVAAMTR